MVKYDGKILAMDKVLVVDKPKGLTSYQVVEQYRKKLGIKNIGHAGTLDPFATGVLILLIGKATKRFKEFLKLEKEYKMVIELGWETDTLDPTGQVINKYTNKQINKLQITKNKILKVLKSFLGEYEQGVPKYSAVKVKGRPLYKYARKGEKVKLPKRKVKIKEIELSEFKRFKRGYPRIKIRVVCSSGTYMRSLAKDIGRRLGVPTVAVELRRARIGSYTIDEKLNN